MVLVRLCGVIVLSCLATACSPVLDWREVRPEGGELVLLMPCRPDQQQRNVLLAGQSVRLLLAACSAGGQTWGLAHADVGDPARVAVALSELRTAAAANVAASAPQALAFQAAGATPNPGAGRWRLAGRLPDGNAVQEEVAVFARGTRVYQATVLGAQLPGEGVETFFGSLRAGS